MAQLVLRVLQGKEVFRVKLAQTDFKGQLVLKEMMGQLVIRVQLEPRVKMEKWVQKAEMEQLA
jgi:hypothetical protein